MRHERVDPLYRSVGAFAQADREQDALDLTGTLDVVTWQAGVSRGRDNLAAIRSSVLTSRSEGATANVSMSTASLVSYSASCHHLAAAEHRVLVQGRQFAESAPASNDFRPQDLADQANASAELSAQWQLQELAGVVSRQSYGSRQSPTGSRSGRLRGEHAGTLGRTGTLAVRSMRLSTLGNEHQRNRELAQVTRVRRVGSTANWRPTSAYGHLDQLDRRRLTHGRQACPMLSTSETRVELSHRLPPVWTRAECKDRADCSYAMRVRPSPVHRLTLLLPDAPPPSRATQMRWSLNSGLSLKAW